MRHTCLWTRGTRLLASLGLLFAQAWTTAPTALGNEIYGPRFAPRYYCPPRYPQPSTEAHPPRTDGMRPSTPSDSTSPSSPGTTDTQTPTTDTTPSPQFSDPSSSSGSLASLSPGANTPMLGRNDQSNRFNLFDNMSAAPANRVWFGLQYANTFGTAITPTAELLSATQTLSGSHPLAAFGSLDNMLLQNEQITTDYFFANQNLYRVGAEYAPYSDLSIAVQGQYISTLGSGEANDDWTNPQILIKYVLASDADTYLTATLGVTPEISSSRTAVNERTTKIYPGLLMYESVTPDCFVQGGTQFNIPLRDDQITTFDWSLGIGYWLYRAERYCPSSNINASLITGLIPQINLLGKHVIGDPTVTGAFGFQDSATTIVLARDSAGNPTQTFTPAGGLPNGFVIYDEPEDVVDFTVGTAVLIGSSLQLQIGYSVPVSHNSVRESELLSVINFMY